MGTASGSGIVTNTLRRSIVHRTMGNKHGPITRLVSPGDLGELIKPFIFLDLFQPPPNAGFKGFGWHPHSGICTVTVILRGRSWYEETVHPRGELETGGVEFFRAARGACLFFFLVRFPHFFSFTYYFFFIFFDKFIRCVAYWRPIGCGSCERLSIMDFLTCSTGAEST